MLFFIVLFRFTFKFFLYFFLKPLIFIIFNVYLFILRERERESTSGGEAKRERGRERIPSGAYAVGAEPDRGLDLTNRDIMT